MPMYSNTNLLRYTFSVFLGVLTAWIYTAYLPEASGGNKLWTKNSPSSPPSPFTIIKEGPVNSPSSEKETVVKNSNKKKFRFQNETVTTALRTTTTTMRKEEELDVGSREKKRKEDVDGNLPSTRSASPTSYCGRPLPVKYQWSCNDERKNNKNKTTTTTRRRCCFLFHAFHLSQRAHSTPLQQLLEKNVAGEEVWNAVISAQSVKQYYPELDILLATNYPEQFIINLLRNVSTTPLQNKKNALPSFDSIFTKILSVLTPTSSSSSSSFSLYQTKSDALLPSLLFSLGYLRVIYLDYDLLLERRFVQLPTYPLTGGSMKTIDPNHEGGKVQRENVEKSLSQGGLLERLFSSMRISLYDVLDTLNTHDMALVPEINSFNNLGPYLYSEVFNISMCATDPFEQFGTRKIYKVKINKECSKNQALYETQYNTGMIAYRTTSTLSSLRQLMAERNEEQFSNNKDTEKEKKKGTRTTTHDDYTHRTTTFPESSTSECGAPAFIHRWSVLHRQIPRCLKDTVLWDQCSFPFALREGQGDEGGRRGEAQFDAKIRGEGMHAKSRPSRGKMRVASLPDIFNFRQALGSSCSPLIQLQDEIKKRNQKMKNGDGKKEKVEREAGERPFEMGKEKSNRQEGEHDGGVLFINHDGKKREVLQRAVLQLERRREDEKGRRETQTVTREEESSSSWIECRMSWGKKNTVPCRYKLKHWAPPK